MFRDNLFCFTDFLTNKSFPNCPFLLIKLFYIFSSFSFVHFRNILWSSITNCIGNFIELWKLSSFIYYFIRYYRISLFRLYILVHFDWVSLNILLHCFIICIASMIGVYFHSRFWMTFFSLMYWKFIQFICFISNYLILLLLVLIAFW